jgi:hypothetical protein
MAGGLIQGRVIGGEAVERKFLTVAPQEVRVRVRAAIRGLGYTLQSAVVGGTLNGGVLNRRSGRLARSVNTRFIEEGDVFRSLTGSALVYGRAWELGFHVPERDIYPVKAGALFWPGASHPVRHVHQPARDQAAKPWLRPPLNAMRPVIKETLAAAMRGL